MLILPLLGHLIEEIERKGRAHGMSQKDHRLIRICDIGMLDETLEVRHPILHLVWSLAEVIRSSANVFIS